MLVTQILCNHTSVTMIFTVCTFVFVGFKQLDYNNKVDIRIITWPYV